MAHVGAIALAGAFIASALASPAFAQQPPDCDKACLAGMMDQYLAALAAHDFSKAPLSRDVKYTENGQTLALTDGLWNTVKGPPSYKFIIADPDNRQVAMMGMIDEGTNHNWISIRLMVEKHHITEIENLIVRSTGAGFGNPVKLTAPNPLFLEEEPAGKRLSRDQLVAIANSYFTGLDTEESARNIPFDPDCQRMENGSWTANSPDPKAGAMQKMTCGAQFDTGFSTIVTNIRARRFPVVDREHGLVYALGFFDHNGIADTMGGAGGKMGDADGSTKPVTGPFSQPLSFMIAELFKVKDGKIRQVEAVLTTVPYGMPSGW